MTEIPSAYRGWWRIIETSQWAAGGLDILGFALLSATGYADRLRMHCLLALRAVEPDEAIPDPPTYRDKWRRRQ